MDALDLLEQQHREVSTLIEQIAEETSPGLRTSLVVKLARAIEAHSRIEERAFYPTLRSRIGDHERLNEALEDHALLRYAADNLVRTRATFVRFEARLKLLQQLFLRHAATDEDWVFPKAKRTLSDEELDHIGVELARVHHVLMHSPSIASAPTRSRWSSAPSAASPSKQRTTRRRPTTTRPRTAVHR